MWDATVIDTKRLVVVDANPLMYRSFHSPGTRNLTTSTGMLSGGFYGFLRSYLALRKRFVSAHFVFCFDCGRSWRNDVFSSYKTHGTDTKPNNFSQQLGAVRTFLHAIRVPVFMELRLEADDLISLIACQWVQSNKNNSSIIVSSDRDFFQVVTPSIMVYDDRAKKFYGPAEVEESTGVQVGYFLSYKCMIGDVSDKIPGIRGFGKVKAAACVSNSAIENIFTREQQEIYDRNKRLIQLPKNIWELEAPKIKRDRINTRINKIFSHFMSSPFDRKSLIEYMDHCTAQKLLDDYECKSFRIGDFI